MVISGSACAVILPFEPVREHDWQIQTSHPEPSLSRREANSVFNGHDMHPTISQTRR
jgi:hypothetical protein